MPYRVDCRNCPLAATRRRLVRGRGPLPADVLLIGEAPGESEDLTGIAFSGPSGRLLNQMLEFHALTERTRVENMICCRPPNNRDPLPSEVLACSPMLLAAARAARPRIVVFAGREPERYYRREWPNALQLVHPSALLRGGAGRSPFMEYANRALETAREMLNHA